MAVAGKPDKPFFGAVVVSGVHIASSDPRCHLTPRTRRRRPAAGSLYTESLRGSV